MHKYAYCHSDPVNCVDPSGEYTLLDATMVVAKISILAGIITWSLTGSLKKGFILGTIVFAALFLILAPFASAAVVSEAAATNALITSLLPAVQSGSTTGAYYTLKGLMVQYGPPAFMLIYRMINSIQGALTKMSPGHPSYGSLLRLQAVAKQALDLGLKGSGHM